MEADSASYRLEKCSKEEAEIKAFRTRHHTLVLMPVAVTSDWSSVALLRSKEGTEDVRGVPRHRTRG